MKILGRYGGGELLCTVLVMRGGGLGLGWGGGWGMGGGVSYEGGVGVGGGGGGVGGGGADISWEPEDNCKSWKEPGGVGIILRD